MSLQFQFKLLDSNFSENEFFLSCNGVLYLNLERKMHTILPVYKLGLVDRFFFGTGLLNRFKVNKKNINKRSKIKVKLEVFLENWFQNYFFNKTGPKTEPIPINRFKNGTSSINRFKNGTGSNKPVY